jgi:hypothetical protein
MDTAVFWGRVLPERSYLNSTRIEHRARIILPGREFDATFSVDIVASQIVVRVVGDWDGVDTATLKNIVRSHISTVVDAFGFTLGMAFEIEITGVIDSSGQPTVFGSGIPELTKNEPDKPLQLRDLVNALDACPNHLALALADLREAHRDPLDTPFHCYRAIETVMQYFRNTGGTPVSKDQAWNRLRTSLRITENFIRTPLVSPATHRRHGGVSTITHAERISQLRCARTIISRFCRYINQGCLPLHESGYPILDAPKAE